MAAGDLIFQDYQYEYKGVLFGWDSTIDVEELSGFIGYPTVRSSIDDALGRHGGVPGRHYLPARSFTMEFNIHGDADDIEYAAQRNSVVTALAPITLPTGEIPFVYQHPGIGKRFISCRPTDLSIPENRMYALKYPHGTARFEATDPRHYDLAVRQTTATLPVPGGGLDFPINFAATGGLNFGAGESNSTAVLNEGNAPANFKIIVSGPVSDPIIDMTDESGTTNTLTISGLTVQLGEQLVFNTKNRSITIGSQSRRRFLTPQSTWTTLPPGEVITFSYRSADDPPTSSTATVVWNDAYWGD